MNLFRPFIILNESASSFLLDTQWLSQAQSMFVLMLTSNVTIWIESHLPVVVPPMWGFLRENLEPVLSLATFHEAVPNH